MRNRDSRGRFTSTFVKVDTDEVNRMYLAEKLSMPEIADKLGCDRKTVEYHLRKAGCKTRNRSEAVKLARSKYPYPSGEQNHRWKGGRVIRSGNVYLLKPDHPRASNSDGMKGYVLEHIYVWEQTHNKPLPKGWVIHHLNGIHTDNRPSNLKAMPSKKHANLIPTFQQKIRELEAENRQLRRALEDSQMIFTVSEN